MDCVGWVDHNPILRIAAMVDKKSQELPRYIKESGSDIRLLIVANRLHNSGKLTLEGKAPLDTRGFHAVYFFLTPKMLSRFC